MLSSAKTWRVVSFMGLVTWITALTAFSLAGAYVAVSCVVSKVC